MPASKSFFVEQLAQVIRQNAQVAKRSEEESREAAATLATESEKKEDSRAALEFGSMATGQAARHRKALEELEALERFAARQLPAFARTGTVGLGALVDVSTETDHGREERSFILMPVGAGTELTGPDGDGFLSVITPHSPVGRALIGKRVGDTVEVNIRGEWREWSVTDLS